MPTKINLRHFQFVSTTIVCVGGELMGKGGGLRVISLGSVLWGGTNIMLLNVIPIWYCGKQLKMM